MKQYSVKIIEESRKIILANNENDAKQFIQNWLDLDEDLELVSNNTYIDSVQLVKENI